MNRKLFHSDKNLWAEIEINLKDGKLSITGSMGEVLTVKQAELQALDYWKSFFEDSPSEIIEMNKRVGSKCHNALQAAKHVLKVDGKFHGLDVYKVENGKVYIVNTCGQCIDSIMRDLPSFPKIERIVEIWEKWHLNDMKAGTERQEKCLKTLFKDEPIADYIRQCEFLESNHLLYDEIDDAFNGKLVRAKYKYGSSWLKRELPSAIIEELKNL